MIIDLISPDRKEECVELMAVRVLSTEEWNEMVAQF